MGSFINQLSSGEKAIARQVSALNEGILWGMVTFSENRQGLAFIMSVIVFKGEIEVKG